MSEIDRIAVPGYAPPAGHYSPVVAWRDLAFVSGQLPALPNGVHIADQPFEVQARQVLANLFAGLAAAGSSPDRVLKVTVYIADIARWPEFNRLYAEAFGEVKPARAVVPVPELHHGYLVEVEAIAAR